MKPVYILVIAALLGMLCLDCEQFKGFKSGVSDFRRPYYVRDKGYGPKPHYYGYM